MASPASAAVAGPVDQAKRVIAESVRGVYFVAGTQAVAALVLGGGVVLDAMAMFVLAFWLRRSYSRTPATALLVLGIASSVLTVANAVAASAEGGGGRSVVLAAI